MVSEMLLLGSVSCDRITHSYKAQDLNLNYLVNLSRSRSDQQKKKEKVMRFNKMITLGKCFDLLSNSLN